MSENDGWMIIPDVVTGGRHIIPDKDVFIHHLRADCECNPVLDEEYPNNVIHFAFDAREYIARVERGEKIV